MKSIFKIVFLLFLFVSILNSAPIDTGMKLWFQPNEVSFYARLHGDEFLLRFTTDDNYEIYKGTDGWYYYAVLDEFGNIIPTERKVRIDEPPEESYNIQIPQSRLTEIENLRNEFNIQLQLADEWYRQKRIEANGGAVTLKIGVILVDFADSVHLQKIYKRQYFNDMIFSNSGAWFDTVVTDPNVTHPENQKIFGSLRDYLNQQSCGKLDIIGKNMQAEILNPPDPNNDSIPDWVYLDQTKEYWNSQPEHTNIMGAALNKFMIKFPNINLSEYDRFIFIYAGEEGFNALWPRASYYNGLQMSERWYGGSNAVFSHIGIFCHEFGHLLGAQDEYEGQIKTYTFDIMDHGGLNGPNDKGACPSGFNPYNRIRWEWINPVTLNETNYIDLEILYDYNFPKYYKINSYKDPTEYFIIENRLRVGFDLYTPNQPNYITTDPNDIFNFNYGGLLVWTIDKDNNNGDKVGIKSDSNSYGNHYKYADFPFPWYRNDPPNYSGQNITLQTTPNNSIRSVTNSEIEIRDIRWNQSENKIILNIINQCYTISQNEIWDNERTFSTNLFIASGKTLTLREGAKLQFTNGKKLIISNFSKLRIESVNLPIEIKSTNPPNEKWGGIELFGNNSHIEGAKLLIDNANVGLTIPFNRNLIIKEIIFKNITNAFNFVGIKTDTSYLHIESCFFNGTNFNIVNPNSQHTRFNFINSIFSSCSLNFYANIFVSLVNNDFYISNILFPQDKNHKLLNSAFQSSTLSGITTSSFIKYNCIYPTPTNISLFSQVGNFSADPKFVNPATGDFRLHETSPCIDMGDPTMDYSNEPNGGGGRINIGSYGNTTSATSYNPNNPQIFSGNNVSFLGDFEIPGRKWKFDNSANLLSGKTLTINPAAELFFYNNSSLNLDGNLISNGTLEERIIYDFIDQYREYPFNGIKLESERSAQLSYSTIKNAYWGIYADLSFPYIENCEFDNSSGSTISFRFLQE